MTIDECIEIATTGADGKPPVTPEPKETDDSNP